VCRWQNSVELLSFYKGVPAAFGEAIMKNCAASMKPTGKSSQENNSRYLLGSVPEILLNTTLVFGL